MERDVSYNLYSNKKEILKDKFNIPLNKIDKSLIKLFFDEKFNLHYYSVKGIKKFYAATIINYPDFYRIFPVKKEAPSLSGCLLDLLYKDKPKSIDYQINLILVSKKLLEELRSLGSSALNNLIYPKKKCNFIFSNRKDGTKMILLCREKEKELTKISWLVHDFLLSLKRSYLETHNNLNWIHSSGIALDNKAMLFIGPSNSGKSTTAYRLCNTIRKSKFLSDDACGIMFSKGRANVLGTPFPSNLRLEAQIFFKKKVRFLPRFKKGIVINQNPEFIKPIPLSALFFLVKTNLKDTKILDLNAAQLKEFTKLHNNEAHAMLHNTDFNYLVSKDKNIIYKLVMLGKNIVPLADYIKNLAG